jgi:poly(ADP-ribose) glycohydrolase ARH3
MANSLSPKSGLLQSRFRGCLLGLAVGDAIGAPFEGSWFSSIDQVRVSAGGSSLLRYTDDTHMAIGIAESLIDYRGFDGPGMAEIFVKNYEQEPWRGYGPGPPRIFNKIRAGSPWDRAAEDIYPGGSYGNGSAMRVAPLALFFYRDRDKLISTTRLQSRITHTHPLGIEGAILQALAVALAAGDGPTLSARDILDQLKTYTTEEVYLQKLTETEALLNTANVKEIARRLGNGIEAFNSVPTAICCALRHPDSFEEAVLEAVSLGGDADTIACMAGAISGARLGIESIPEEWIAKLENSEYLQKLALDLWKAAQ